MNPSTPPDLAHWCYMDPAAAAAEITTLRADNARLVAENAEMFAGWKGACGVNQYQNAMLGEWSRYNDLTPAQERVQIGLQNAYPRSAEPPPLRVADDRLLTRVWRVVLGMKGTRE